MMLLVKLSSPELAMMTNLLTSFHVLYAADHALLDVEYWKNDRLTWLYCILDSFKDSK